MATVVKDLGAVTAYAYAVAGGYSGTEAEFEALLGNIAEDLSEIENLSVTVTTLPAGSSATASYSNGVLSLGIPKGDKGDKGDTGATGATGPTGNGISTITKTGTSGLVDTYTITFTNGGTTTFTVTNGEDGEVTTAQMNAAIETALEDYAKVDGSYSSLTAGNAEQLVSTVGVTDKTPYLFRTTGGSADVGDRVKLSEITGGTVAWNQLVNTGDTSVTVPNGHKYYSRINSVQTIGESTGSAISINDASEDNVFDLTAMFGSTIADYLYTLESGTACAGIAKLMSWGFCTAPYYAYNAGTLLSVKTTAHKEYGFNAYNPDTGKAKVVGGQVYQITGTYTALSLDGTSITPDASGYFTPAASGELTVTGGNATDTCIHLKWDGERDGEWEEYSEYTYPLDDVELRGIPKLDVNNNLYYDGDSYAPDGTVTRKYGIVTLDGDADVSFVTDTGDTENTAAWTSYSDVGIKKAMFVADKRVPAPPVGSSTATVQGSIWCSNGASRMWFTVPKTVTDKASLKTYLASNPITVVYQLATPTTESADPYQETQVCNDFGTEEFVDSRTVPMPVGSVSFYQNNLRSKLEAAPESPSLNGDYIMRRTNNGNAYVPLIGELPADPAEDGTYTLKVTVSSGTATLSWVSDT